MTGRRAVACALRGARGIWGSRAGAASARTPARGAPPENRRRARDAGLAEVAGAVMAVAVAVGAGSAFYLAVLDSAETHSGANDIHIAGLRLVAPVPGGAVSSVYAEATISVLYAEEVGLGGDVSDTVLFDGRSVPQDGSGAGGLAVSASGSGVIIHYSGMLNLTEPKSPGDAVSVIVRYGDQSRSVSAEVEGA